MTDRPHGAKNLAKIATTLRKNRESAYTEEMSKLHDGGFRYEEHADRPWQVEGMSLFAGSPLWAQASASQRLALNHLWWVAFYQLVCGAERQTILLNQLCANALFPLGGYETVCLELDLETTQERHHITAFTAIGQATERAILGFPVFTPTTEATAPELMNRIGAAGGRLARVGEHLLTSVLFTRITRSPFLASQYFLLRSFFNFFAKHREALAYELHRELQQEGAPIAAPLGVIHYHYLDEAFHTAVSQLIAHDLYKDLPKPTATEIRLVNLLVKMVQDQVFNHLGGMMAGALGNEGVALPKFYRILRSRAFALSHAEAMAMLERCFCEEHDGFHQSAKLGEKLTDTLCRATADIDHLWASNREFPTMRNVRLDAVLARNRRTFAAFARTQRDEAPAYST